MAFPYNPSPFFLAFHGFRVRVEFRVSVGLRVRFRFRLGFRVRVGVYG